MVSRRVIVAVVGIVAWSSVSSAMAQVSSSGLLPPNVIRRYGLERIWHTQIEVDRGRGHVLHVSPYVNNSKAVTLFEVTFEHRRFLFSEYDKDPFGKPLGVNGAKQRAEEQIAELKILYPESKAEPAFDTIISPEITLYATTNRGVVHAIDGETGKTRWVANVGKSDYPTTAAAANDEYVAVLNGSRLYVLNAANGEFEWQVQVVGVPAAGPALSAEYVFAPMVDGSMESYELRDSKQPPWIYKGLGRSFTQPVTGLDSLAWPTDRGHLYVAATGINRAIRYRLEAKQTIVSTPTFVAPDKLIATSADGFAYCMSPFRQSSNLIWQFSTGESISKSPVALGDVVYVITDDKHMFAISTKDGFAKWDSPTSGIKKLLAASKDRLYVAGDVGRLAILEAETGARVAEIPTIDYDLFVTNTMTDRLYVGSRNGTIQCLREISNRWPVFHQAVAPTKPKPKIVPRPAGPKPDAGDDPFNAPAGKPAGGDDPFAAPGEKPAAPKPAAKPGDDPFG